MSVSVSAHMKNAVDFTIKGSANHSHYGGGTVYPVISIEFRDEHKEASNSVTLFPNTEQLMALQKAITRAIREVELLKEDIARNAKDSIFDTE